MSEEDKTRKMGTWVYGKRAKRENTAISRQEGATVGGGSKVKPGTEKIIRPSSTSPPREERKVSHEGKDAA